MSLVVGRLISEVTPLNLALAYRNFPGSTFGTIMARMVSSSFTFVLILMTAAAVFTACGQTTSSQSPNVAPQLEAAPTSTAN